MTKLVLLIPAYQPAAELPGLVQAILEAAPSIARALVVDDGSGPAHTHTFAQLRHMDRVEVLTHAINLGKGAALKTGFNAILAGDPLVTGIVTADADGQHRPADIVQVAAAHAARPDALVLGARAFEGEVPWRSRIGNQATRFFFHLFTGLRLRDTQTGLRVWPRAQCLAALRLPFYGYEFEFEALMQARHGQIHEVPIRTVYEPHNPTSHFNPVRDSLRIYFVFLRYSASALLAALLDSTVFSAVLWRGGSLAAAQAAGRAVATVAAFFILRSLVFRNTAAFWGPLARFLALVGVSGAVSYALMRALIGAGAPPLGAKLLAEGTLFAANFAVQRTLIFRRD